MITFIVQVCLAGLAMILALEHYKEGSSLDFRIVGWVEAAACVICFLSIGAKGQSILVSLLLLAVSACAGVLTWLVYDERRQAG